MIPVYVYISTLVVTECKFVFLMQVRPNTRKHCSLELRKVYCRTEQGDGCLCPPNPELLEGFQKSTYEGRVKEGRG